MLEIIPAADGCMVEPWEVGKLACNSECICFRTAAAASASAAPASASAALWHPSTRHGDIPELKFSQGSALARISHTLSPAPADQAGAGPNEFPCCRRALDHRTQ